MKILVKEAAAAVLLIIICGVSAIAAQDKLRQIVQPAKFVYPNTPIEVTFSLDGKQLPNREIQAGPDWLRKISLDVANTSSKDINLLWINLILKEPVYGANVSSAETAGIVITVELRHSGIKVLPAGDQITLKPPATMVDYWTKYALEQGIEDIQKVILDIRQVGFTDNTTWTRGRLSRKDPKSGRMVFVTDPAPPDLQSSTSIFVPVTPPVLFFLTQ